MRVWTPFLYLFITALCVSAASPGLCNSAPSPEQNTEYAPYVDQFIHNCGKKTGMRHAGTPNRRAYGLQYKRMFDYFTANRSSLIMGMAQNETRPVKYKIRRFMLGEYHRWIQTGRYASARGKQ